MRDGDDLYFAPNVRFGEVDLSGPRLPEQIYARIDGYYLAPARICIRSRHAFAAGVLLVSTIDFMAGLRYSAGELKSRKVGTDFRDFVQSEMQSFRPSGLASRFYEEFRNGLTHEARIKNAGEFSFNWQQTVRLAGGRLCINPSCLLEEVEVALKRQIDKLKDNQGLRLKAATRLRCHFVSEFGIIQAAQRAV
jgi:hypothetical protein